MELLTVDTLEEAKEKLKKHLKTPPVRQIPILSSLGMVLGEDVFSGENIPPFDRSRVDGYAVISADVQGASDSLPVFLDVIGEVNMGEAADTEIRRGQCMYVPTGGMLPPGADSMVMVEYSQEFGSSQIALYKSAAPGEYVLVKGEETKAGDVILKKGHRICGADFGLLSSAGISQIKVYRPWKLFIISTGDELKRPEDNLLPGQIHDINTYSLLGEAMENGLEISGYQVVTDSRELIEEAVRSAMSSSDFVILSGGSSKGKKDMTADVFKSLADCGVLTHGIAIKPGKPTIIAYDRESSTALLGLPGHAVGAWLLFRLIVADLWRDVCGQSEKRRSIRAVMGFNIPGAGGKDTYQLVKLCENSLDADLLTKKEVHKDTDCLPVAFPVLGHSALIRTVSEADGYVVIDRFDEGVDKGQICEVILL